MIGKTALVTGASRGVGARTAVLLATAGADVVINYRERKVLADRVSQDIVRLGRRAPTARADLTDPGAIRRMFTTVARTFDKLDVLVLNASGGLEKDRPPDYARRLNVDAQLQVVDLALPLMPVGGRVVYVTSHHAHFYGQQPTIAEYEPVAASKRAGEDALRVRLDELTERGLRLVVVSGDVIERTVTAVLLERARPEIFQHKRTLLGKLLNVDEFATAVARAARDPGLDHGTTIYVGSTD